MLDLSATLQAEMLKQAIRLDVLLAFDFLSGMKRYWTGRGMLVTGGFNWDGVPVLISIDAGRLTENGAAEKFTIGVSGVSATFLAETRDAQTEVKGRECQIYLQFFDDNLKPLDSPIRWRTGRMQSISYHAVQELRSVTITCESRFTARGLPPAKFLSVAEQQRRFPGNLGLIEIPALQNKTVIWPKFDDGGGGGGGGGG